VRTKISQVKAGLEALNSSSLEVRVSSGKEETLHLSSELIFQPNLDLKAGDLIYLLGKLGSVQGLYSAFETHTHGESWYQLRNQFNQDFKDLIDSSMTLGAVDGNVLDERGLIRNLEDMVVPSNLGVSLDLDRIPIHSVEQRLAVDRESRHVLRNIEHSKYLPEELETLMHHPRFLALFGAEVSGLIFIFPKDMARNIIGELSSRFPKSLLTPIGALTEGPVRFRFRLTTK
jgi:hypothetical protein